MSNKIREQVCGLCERNVSTVSLHHLIPKEEGGRHGETITLCQPCHSTIHLTYSNRELAREFNTIPSLRSAPALQKYLKWIRSRNIERISNRRGKN